MTKKALIKDSGEPFTKNEIMEALKYWAEKSNEKEKENENPLKGLSEKEVVGALDQWTEEEAKRRLSENG